MILVVNLTISDLTAVIKIVPLDHLLLLLDPLKEMEIFSNYKYQLFDLNPFCGRVSESAALISIRAIELDPALTRQEIENMAIWVERKYCNGSRNNCDYWNTRAQSVARQFVQDRSDHLIKHANMVSSLGIPLEMNLDAPKN